MAGLALWASLRVQSSLAWDYWRWNITSSCVVTPGELTELCSLIVSSSFLLRIQKLILCGIPMGEQGERATLCEIVLFSVLKSDLPRIILCSWFPPVCWVFLERACKWTWSINSIELSVQDLTVSLKSTSLSPNIVQVGNSKADVLLHINYLEKSPFQWKQKHPSTSRFLKVYVLVMF